MEERQDTAQDDVPRISSGTAHLDQVLAGGWLRGGLYVIGGPPGSGKTTLGNQFCFAAAGRGENALYVTMLVEPHGRMALHLRSMSFYRPELVGDRMVYLSGAAALEEGGPRALLELLTRQLRERKVKALVIDGVGAVREAAGSSAELRRFVHALSTTCSLTGCTALLLATESEGKVTEIEYAIADGIVQLSADLLGLKATRGLEVIKFRGSTNLPGKHTFLVTRDGVQVYPRYEAVHTETSRRVPDPRHRLSWGIPRLDDMCAGGVVSLSNTLLLGSPGSGKTLLGLNFLVEGARRGEPGLYFGFAENAGTLVQKATSTGLADFEALAEKGLLRLEVRAPVETLPDAMAQELLALVKEQGTRRLVLDGLEPFAKEAIDPERTTRFVSALMSALRDEGVTVLAAQQTNVLFGPELNAPIHGTEAIFDNMVLLRFFELNGQLFRLLSVLKMRDSENDPFLRQMRITSRGVDVLGSFTELEGLVTGQPRGHSAHQAGPPPGARPARVRAQKKQKRKPSGGKGKRRTR